MSRYRDESVMLICDEAYLLVDERLPQSLMYLIFGKIFLPYRIFCSIICYNNGKVGLDFDI